MAPLTLCARETSRPGAFGSGMIAVLLLALWLVVAPGVASAAPIAFPALTGRVVDDAQLLSPAQEEALTGKLAALEQQTGDQLVVVTVPSLQDQEIEDFGYQLGRHWGIGQKENDGGALLLVAPTERKVRIEVGYGLEGVLTDAYSSIVIRDTILPAFRKGDYASGILAGTDALIVQLTADPAEAAARAEEAKVTAEATGSGSALLPAIIIFVIFFSLFASVISAAAGGRRRGGKGRGSGLGPILIWAASEALRNQGRGAGGGWGGGGGGFGGGGGGFGGGGASGGW